MPKIKLDIDVYESAKKRICYVFDNFEKIYVSFSGGKDSSVMFHMVADEAKKRNRIIGLLFVDLEAQYKLTIDHVREMFDKYEDIIEPYWVSLPIHLRNGVSQYEPHWICWDANRQLDWVRNPDGKYSITNIKHFPFFKTGMEFEEFVPAFGKWFGNGKLTACFVGIRSDESLNRYRTMCGKKTMFEYKKWTTWLNNGLYNIYPIYDWRTEDIWTFNGKYKTKYNKLYDRMHLAGLTIHQQRICQPYGDDQRKGLWLFQVIEPETWSRVLARVNGANQGSLYAKESGNILGNMKISKPNNHTWESFSLMILQSMPSNTREHYKNKISVFVKWWMDKDGLLFIPDDGPLDKSAPSWKRICKTLLRNDYWCKGLSFSQHKSEAYEKYKKLMKRRLKIWNIPNGLKSIQ